MLAFSISLSKKSKVSSAYCRLITPPSATYGSKPVIKFCLAAFISILVKTSATKLKSRGDRGSPCRRPLPGLKKILFSSLSLIQIDPPSTNFFIQLIQVALKPLAWSMSSKKTLANPAICFFIIKFENDSRTFTSMHLMNNLMGYYYTLKNVSPFYKSSLVRSNESICY